MDKKIIIAEKDRDQYLAWMRELVAYCGTNAVDPEQRPVLLRYLESPETLTEAEKAEVKRLEPLFGVDLNAAQQQIAQRKSLFAGVTMDSIKETAPKVFKGGAIAAAAGLVLTSSVLPVTVPIVAVAGSVLAVQSVKWIREHKKEIEELVQRAKAIKQKNEEAIREKIEKIQENAAQLQQKMQEIGQKYAQKVKETAKEYEEFMKEAAKHAAIDIDDAMHQNVNKRIQRYQEIALKQYRNQMEFEKSLYELTVLYNEVIAENERLQKEILFLQQKNTAVSVAEGSLGSKIKADKEA